jgi:regulatory protein
MARAARDLARRPRSAEELRTRLGRVTAPEVAESVVDDLERIGYVDDAALARALADRRLAHGWGRARVEADLARLGIEGEAAADALRTAEAGEPEAAARLLARDPSLGRDPRRAWALLARRGFGESVAEGAVERCASAGWREDS